MKPSLLIVSLMFLSASVMAQSNCNLELQGSVIDEHDGSALGFANIYIEGLNIGTISDKSGNYLLSGLCPGEWIVVCSHVGCEPIRDTISLTKNMELNFYPEHHAELLEGIAIVDQKKETLQLIGTLVPDLNQSSGQSLGNVLESVTGVTNLSSGANIAKPMIHGLHSNRVLILNNGIRQEGQQWGVEHAPEIDPLTAGEIRVIKGAQSVRYGPDAMGGVVIISPRSLPDSSGLQGSVHLSGQTNGLGGTAGALLEGRSQKLPALSWRAQGSLKKLGDVHAPNYILTNTGAEEWNFSGLVSLANEQRGMEFYYSQFNTNLAILSASHIGNLTDLYRAFEADQPAIIDPFSYEINAPYQHVEHELLKASAFTNLGENTTVELIYGRQYNLRTEFDRHGGGDVESPELQFEIVTHSLDLILANKGNGRNKFEFGAHQLIQENTYEGRFFIPAFRKWNSGIFFTDRLQVLEDYHVEFGARIDYVSQQVFRSLDMNVQRTDHTFLQPSFSIGLIRQVKDRSRFSLQFANAWRPPNVNELYSDGLHHGSATYEIGDTNLSKEVSYTISSSWLYNMKWLRIETEVYGSYFDGYINLSPQFPATLTIRGAFPTFAYSQINALLYGIDNKASFTIRPWLKLISSTSIIRAREFTSMDWINQIPADRSSLAMLFTKEVNETTASFEPSIQWVNKQWRIPNGGDYLSPPPSYTLIHFSINVSRPMLHGQTSIGLEAANLLNQRYRNYLNRNRYFADEMGRNIIFRITHEF